MSSLIELPPELQEIIYLYVDLSSLRKLPLLSKTICRLVLSPSFWLAKLRREFPDANMKEVVPLDYRDYYLGLIVKMMKKRSRTISNDLPEADEDIKKFRAKIDKLRLKLHTLTHEVSQLTCRYMIEAEEIVIQADQLKKRIRKVRPEKERRYLDIRLDPADYNHFEELRYDEIMSGNDLNEHLGNKFQHRDLVRVSMVDDPIYRFPRYLIYVAKENDLNWEPFNYPPIFSEKGWSIAEIEKAYKLPFVKPKGVVSS
jgi:hypothetical protein